MLNFTKLNFPIFHARIWKTYALSIKALTGVFLLFTLLLSETASAQFDCPNAKRCTSNDLAVVSASLTGVGACFTCTPGATINTTITLVIENKTGSVRTSFALFGNFVHGNTTVPIFICGGPIAPNSQSTVISDQVSFICGEQLRLTNNYLAWTDASDGEKNTCDAIEAGNCKTIAPKCGTAADIIIPGPLVGTVSDPVIPCAGTCTGSFKVTATGGTSPFTYVLGATSVGPIAGAATFSNQCAGAKTVSVTDAAGCTATVSYTLTDKACCVAPPKPIVCETPASVCGGGTASITISNAVINDIYYLAQDAGGITASSTATSSTLTFTGLTPGKNFSVYGKDVQGGTTCTGAAATCADLTGTCPPVEDRTSKAPTRLATVAEPQTSVKAYPNPFSDRVKFLVSSSVAGNGNLEVYNMMGQKVKTVYTGYIVKGTQTFELSLPTQQVANLVYVLRVGDKKMTGKILQINR